MITHTNETDEQLVEVHVASGAVRFEVSQLSLDPARSKAGLRALDKVAERYAATLGTVVLARVTEAKVESAAALGAALAERLSHLDADLGSVHSVYEYLDKLLVKLPGRPGSRAASLRGVSSTLAAGMLAEADVLGIPWSAAEPFLEALSRCRDTHPGASVAAAYLRSAEGSMPSTANRSAVYRTVIAACHRWDELMAFGYPAGWAASDVRARTGLAAPE